MSCTDPLLAVRLPIINPDTGKNKIKLLPRRVDYSFQDAKKKYGNDLLVLPCGKCDGCVLARRKLWALRCYAESLYHDEVSFLTLTYDDFHLPRELNKAHFQKFIKDLRNDGLKIRYYGCGEYGSTTHRPHYHIILFGFFPKDAKIFGKSKSGFDQYTSKYLTNVWNKGFVTVSEFTPETAAYTAGYVDKKYKDRDCFTLMSKKPGLGEQYFYDHYEDFLVTDSMVTNFGSHVSNLPRYFEKLAEKSGIDISDLKNNRVLSSNAAMYKVMRDNSFLHEEQYFLNQSRIMKNKLEKKVRGL